VGNRATLASAEEAGDVGGTDMDAIDQVSPDVEPLEEQLRAFVVHAGAVLPAGTECSIIVSSPEGGRRVASSDERSARCDELELVLEAGPCVDAVTDLQVTVARDLDTEERWQPWTRQARDLGFRSVAAFPAQVRGDLRAALNVYSERRDPWDRDTLVRCDVYAQQLAAVVDLQRDVEDLLRVQHRLREALTAQADVDQAIGAVMVTDRCDAATALAVLTSVSRTDDVALPEAARRVLRARGARTADRS
jgi:hypothetical protein